MMKFKGLIAATVTALLTMPSAYAADKTIAFISADNAISFYKYGMDAAVEAGKALNVDVLTYSSKSDPSQELANVQDAITKGAKGIVMYAVSLSSERAAIAQAKRAGVPIFLEYGYDPSILKDTAGIMQMDAEASGNIFAAAGCGDVMPIGQFDQVAASGEAVEGGFDGRAILSFDAQFLEKMLETRLPVRLLRNMDEQRGIRHIHLS